MNERELQKLTFDELLRRYNELAGEFELYRKTMEQRFMLQRDLVDRLSQTKTAILTKLSHSIRIPMNGVLGMIDILKNTPLNQEQADYIYIIQSYSTQLLSMITDLSDLAKIESGNIQIINKTCNITEELDEVIDGFSLIAKGKGIKFEAQYNHLSTEIVCDAYRLKQIISNLLSTAIAKTTSGTIRISVGLRSNGKINHTLDVEITDSSTGLNENENNLLQNAINTKDFMSLLKLEVWGISMAISFQLVRLLNGKIQYDVEKGKGNNFRFSIPVGISSDPNQNNAFTMTNLQSDPPLKILLVEDNLLNQKFAIATLVREGHTVDIAENGKIAIEKFKTNPYDLILMDIQMPVMDGIQATLKIREIERELHKPPIKIVAVTAYALDKDRMACLAAGMDNFLAKPFKPQELVKLIHDLSL